MKRYLIIYSGIVQGVGFRWKLLSLARRLGLSGYCRNLDNGNVECVIQGKDVDLFVKETIKKDRFIEVYDHSIRELPVREDLQSFEVRF